VIYKKLADIRKFRGITQEDLAHAVGVTTTYYRQIEKSKSVPTVKVAMRVCKLLGVTVYEIDEWKDWSNELKQ
jgi:putative transcriptional regulator